MASIKKLDERRYKITVSNGYRPNGKKISKAKTIQVPPGVPKRGIGQYVAHAAEELERSFKTGSAEDGEMTFEEFASRWLKRQTKYAPSTIAAYRRMLEVVYPMIGGIRLNKLRPMALENMLSALRKPALPSLWAGVFIAAAFMFIEGYDYGAVLNVMQNGYTPTVSAELAEAADEAALAALIAKHALDIDVSIAKEIGNDIVELVSAGGMQSMNWTVSLIICAFVFGSAMNVCGFIKTILEAVASRVRTVGGLILSVVVSCLVCNFFLGDQYLGIAMPGTMYKETFDKLGLHPRMLSRSLEDSGTLTSVLVPWNTCGAYHAELFNMSVAEFGPYAFLNWMNPVIAIIMTYLGIGIFWRGKDGEPVRGGKTRPAELA